MSKVTSALACLLHASYGEAVDTPRGDTWRMAVADAQREHDKLRAEVEEMARERDVYRENAAGYDAEARANSDECIRLSAEVERLRAAYARFVGYERCGKTGSARVWEVPEWQLDELSKAFDPRQGSESEGDAKTSGSNPNPPDPESAGRGNAEAANNETAPLADRSKSAASSEPSWGTDRCAKCRDPRAVAVCYPDRLCFACSPCKKTPHQHLTSILEPQRTSEATPGLVRCWRCKHDVPEETTVCNAGVGTQCKDAKACRGRWYVPPATTTATSEAWTVEQWQEDGPMCTRCYATLGWDGDPPESEEDAICHDCAWKELHALRGARRPTEAIPIAPRSGTPDLRELLQDVVDETIGYQPEMGGEALLALVREWLAEHVRCVENTTPDERIVRNLGLLRDKVRDFLLASLGDYNSANAKRCYEAMLAEYQAVDDDEDEDERPATPSNQPTIHTGLAVRCKHCGCCTGQPFDELECWGTADIPIKPPRAHAWVQYADNRCECGHYHACPSVLALLTGTVSDAGPAAESKSGEGT